MEHYVYKPVRFYLTVFGFTWGFWLLALLFKNNTPLLFGFMVLGVASPAVIAVITVLTSKNEMLIDDFKRKLIRFYRIRPLNIVKAVLLFGVVIVLSI